MAQSGDNDGRGVGLKEGTAVHVIGRQIRQLHLSPTPKGFVRFKSARTMPVSYFGGADSLPSPSRSDENYSPGE